MTDIDALIANFRTHLAFGLQPVDAVRMLDELAAALEQSRPSPATVEAVQDLIDDHVVFAPHDRFPEGGCMSCREWPEEAYSHQARMVLSRFFPAEGEMKANPLLANNSDGTSIVEPTEEMVERTAKVITEFSDRGAFDGLFDQLGPNARLFALAQARAALAAAWVGER